MQKKYIIFDLDGTLINSHDNIKNLILKYFEKYDKENYEKARFYLDFDKISSLQELLKQVYENKNCDKKCKEIYDFLDKENHKNDFIDGTIEKLKELKNKYIFYLSTGSSTKVANEILEKGGIKKYFKKILGSEKIPKSEAHLDIFALDSEDKDFFKKAISIGDSPRDELFAKNRGIDFIKIGGKYKSISEIKHL